MRPFRTLLTKHDMNRLRCVLDTLEDGLCLLDSEGRVQVINVAALSLLAYQEEELLERRASDTFISGRDKPLLERLLASGERFRSEFAELKRKDGVTVPVSYSLDPLGADNKRDGTVLRFREVSRPEACDAALRDSETKLRVVLDTIVDGVVAIDEGGLVQLFNPAAERLFGYRSDEVLGCNVRMLMPALEREAHDGYIANYLRTGVKKIIGIGREVTGRLKDGTLFPLYLAIGEARQDTGRLFVAVIHDLRGRRRAEERLLTLSAAVEQSPNAVLISSLEASIAYVNPSFARLTGYSAEEVLGKDPSLLRSPHTPSEKYHRLWQTLSQGGVWQEEIQDRKKSGEFYWAIETISPIRNSEGAITHFLSIQQDITEQKEAKEALQESEERFRQVAEMTGEWLWEQDPEGRYIYCSGAVRDILGYEPEDILGNRYLDLLTDEDKQHWTTELAPAPEIKRRFYRLVNRYRHKDGQEVFTESTGEPIFDAEGRLVKWRGVDHNITARKHYEDALRLRDRAIEAASVGINIAEAMAKDVPNIYVNPALCRLTGYTREELLGHNMRLLQGPDTDPIALVEISRALREGANCEVILKNYRKDGTSFWNDLFISPVRDESGKLTHFVGIQTDVTERRRAEEERHQLEIAKQIQMSLLPKGPLRFEGAQVAGICLPATHVGGDYYDFFSASPKTLDVVIADVSGHSVGAALVMTAVRSALKAETRNTGGGQSTHGVAEILRALNDLLYEDLNSANLFISLFYLRYNPSFRQLCYANAGHNYPLLLRQGASHCEPLDAEGMILGVRKEIDFEERSLALEKGDSVLLYTDGVIEAENQSGEFFGMARLCELLLCHRLDDPETIIHKLLGALGDYCGGQRFKDDVSLVILKAE